MMFTFFSLIARAADDFGLSVAQPASQMGTIFGGTPEALVRGVFTFILGIAGAVFMVIFLIGATSYLTGSGNEEQTSKAKKQMVDSIVGLILTMAAWGLGRAILARLGVRNQASSVQNSQTQETTRDDSPTPGSPSDPAINPSKSDPDKPVAPGNTTKDDQAKTGSSIVLQITHSNRAEKSLSYAVRCGADQKLLAASGSTYIDAVKTPGVSETSTFTIPFQVAVNPQENCTVYLNRDTYGASPGSTITLNIE